MAIKNGPRIVDLPTKSGDFPELCLPEGMPCVHICSGQGMW